jgi:hypothetical protein
VSVPIQNTMHVAQGLSRLSSAFITKPNVRAMLAVYLQPAQDLENAIWSVLTMRFLRTATLYDPAAIPPAPNANAVLDGLGEIVGQPRHGMSDAAYQAMLFLRVAVNRATGRVSDAANFAKILLTTAAGPVSYYEGDAALFLGVWGMTLDPSIVAQALAQAAPNGVHLVFAYSTWADGNDFEWADLNNLSTSGEGAWGDTVAGLVGGPYVSGAGN